MPDARELLRAAARVFDDAGNGLAARAAGAGRGGFAGGAEWMRAALGVMRGSQPRGACSFARLGATKYGVAGCGALVAVAAAVLLRTPWPLLAVPFAFYAVESLLVFAFPAALDGAPRPAAASAELIVRTCGAVAATGTVMQIAWTMLTGGLRGRGFVRSWCLGCLAVLIWYERARHQAADTRRAAA